MPRPRGFAAGVTGVALATLVAAVSGFVVTLLAARALRPEEYSQFATAWAILYMAVAALSGVQQEVARSTAQEFQECREPGARALPSVLLVTAVVAVVVVVVLTGVPGYSTLAYGAIWFVPAIVFLVAGQAVLSGALVGAGELLPYAAVITVEAVARLILFVMAALTVLGGDLFSLVIYAMAPFAAWFVLGVPTGWVRRTATVRGQGSWQRQFRSSMTVASAALVTGLLTTGMPAILSGMITNADGYTLGTIILIVTLTRAPLMMPLIAFQSAIVAYLVKRQLSLQTVFNAVVAVIGAGTVLAALASGFGPVLLNWMFGDTYTTTRVILFWTTFASISLALLFLAGALVLARGSQRGYLCIWAAGAIGTFALLLVPFEPWFRTILALALGPLAGVLVGGIYLVPRKSR